MRSKILKNSTYLLIGQGIVKAVSFFYTLFLARNLQVSEFGLYITALAYFSLISSIADLGFNRYLMREGSRDIHKLHAYLSQTILIRLSITAVAFAVFATWLYLFDRDSLRVSLSLIAVMAVVPQAVAMTLDAVFVVKQKLQYSAIGLLILSVVSSGLGIVLLWRGWGLYGLVAALFLGQVIYMIALLGLLYYQSREKNFAKWLKDFGSITLGDTKTILKGSLPYGILGLLGLLYFRIDTLLLSYMKGSEATGIYGAAYRFLEALLFIPSSVATAMFPVAARLHETDVVRLQSLYFKSLKWLGFLALILCLGYLIVLPFIIKMILPNYVVAIPVIQVLSVTIPFMFIHSPGALLLISTDRFLKQIILLSISSLAFNIILNMLVIPKYSYMGAAVVTVLSEAFSFIIFYFYLQQKLFKGVKK